jgi:hypothetical protein
LLDPEELTSIRATYQPGARVRLVTLGEPDRRLLETGSLGTVRSVDDLGTVHVEWDSGVRLGCLLATTRSEQPDRLELLDTA